MLSNFASVLLVLAAVLGCGSGASATEAKLPLASYAEVGRATLMPYGWHDFCGRHPEACDVEALAAVNIHVTPSVWEELDRVNRGVNRAIVPVTNWDHWGTMLDHWDYPVDGKGDCKIYALQKRRLLLEAGFPRQALLMTIVRDLEGEGHTILTVKTDRGEFVLDNMAERIRPWDATGYRYIKRQSQEDPNVWLDLGGVNTAGDRTARADDPAPDGSH